MTRGGADPAQRLGVPEAHAGQGAAAAADVRRRLRRAAHHGRSSACCSTSPRRAASPRSAWGCGGELRPRPPPPPRRHRRRRHVRPRRAAPRRGAAGVGLRPAADAPTDGRLRRLGIAVAIGHDAGHVAGADVLVVSSAVAAGQPRGRGRARAAGVPVIRRAEMLGEVSRFKWTIAVAGTHGKTTTTSLTGFVLTRAGLDPTVVVGGRVHFLGAHARLGRSEYLVCEADEYDRSFLTLHPVLAVLTTVEAEHLDTYGTVEAMEDAFVDVRQPHVPFYGADGRLPRRPGRAPAAAAPDAPRGHLRRLTPQAEVARPRDRAGRPSGSRCRVVGARRRSSGELHGAAARSSRAGQRAGRHRRGARGRRRVRRRSPRPSPPSPAWRGASSARASAAAWSLVDDYAHHPTEVAATLQAARQAFPDAPPRGRASSRTCTRAPQAFAAQFGEALLAADVALVLPIYPSREQPVEGVTSQLVVRRGACAAAIATSSPAPRSPRPWRPSTPRCGPATWSLTMGAGNVNELGEAWLAGRRGVSGIVRHRRRWRRALRLAAWRWSSARLTGDAGAGRPGAPGARRGARALRGAARSRRRCSSALGSADRSPRPSDLRERRADGAVGGRRGRRADLSTAS